MQSLKQAAGRDKSSMGTMRLRYIEIFQAILEAGTLTDAASLLNISQPAATKLLQQAERRLGFPLFVRAKGRLHLTPESELLRGQMERIFDELRDLQRLASNIARAEHYLLRIVSTPTLASAIVPKSITRMREKLGATTVELSTQHSREMLKSIVLRETDIGFTLQEIKHPDVRCDRLCTGPLVLIAPANTWTAEEAAKPISISCLAEAPLVGITTADSLGRQLESYLSQLEPLPRISIWVQTYQIAKELVCNGEGLALIDPFTAVSSGPGIQIRVVEPSFPVTLYAAYRVDGVLNQVQKVFLDCVTQLAGSLISGLSAPAAAERKSTRPEPV
jgi:DNA-binding transcriptional LysR family regulator